jgi:hypothetical protein
MSEHAWLEQNQRSLAAQLARVRSYLEPGDAPAGDPPAPQEGDPLPALERLCALFELSPFERDVLLLCVGAALDTRFASVVAAREPSGMPTFGLALAVLPNAHWSAVLPNAPLRRWRLITLIGQDIAHATLRIDERVLHHLVGLDYLDERLRGLVRAFNQHVALADSQQTVAEQVARMLSVPPACVQLSVSDPLLRRMITAHACARLDGSLFLADAADLPRDPVERATFAELWAREALLAGRVLLLEAATAADSALLETFGAPLIIGVGEPLALARPHTRVAAPAATTREQRALWHAALGPRASQLNGQIDVLASQFRLSAADIAAIGASTAPDDMWDAARTAARARLDDLAERIESLVGWDDLVLPEMHLATLRELAIHVRERSKVYEQWGFAAKSMRGLGITALFAGASGTGKTLAAEVLARELRLDLYRIDLSQVVSKYIGETEKNLRRVFEAAEGSGAVLLFDEADALFGKRSEVKDSHDRYANIEVGYLLQRMEAYSGLAILTTNQRGALDPAFLRRIRFIIEFPFPDAAQRASIWRKTFPALAPTSGLAYEKLARLHVAGGNIRNIALNAAFLAADSGEPVGMAHLLRAARAECAKIEKPLSEGELAGWLG